MSREIEECDHEWMVETGITEIVFSVSCPLWDATGIANVQIDEYWEEVDDDE